MSLEIGDKCPSFTLPKDNGGEINIADVKANAIVIYFYPKDDTSGCTSEAKQFSDNIEQFNELGVTVYGISKDSIKSHEKFKAKYDLKIDLLSDEALEVCNAFGVWVEKSMYGRKYMGVERSTFIIDKDLKIAKIWRKVKVTNHVADVLKALKSL